MSEKTTDGAAQADLLIKALSAWYVRRDKAFYDVKKLNKKLSVDDVKRCAVLRFKTAFPDITLTSEILKQTFDVAITKMHDDPARMVPTWDGSKRCAPEVDSPFIWDDGMVTVNTWHCPAYRNADVNDCDIDLFTGYLAWMFPREEERQRILDWLTWNLLNEADKPMWAPLLYSKTKGSGKSTSRTTWWPG